MHNCRKTREFLVETALRKVPPDENASLWAELERCSACREEYVSLRNALRVADQAMQCAIPAESFWPTYNARLRQRLEDASESGGESRLAAPGFGVLLWLRKLITASVPVPVPLASIVVVLFVFSILFTIYSRRTLSAAPATSEPSVITKTVEVPVIREKPVIQVVYLERNRRTARQRREETERNASTAIARRQGETTAPVRLVGFKPANDVKLTIIKGSGRDDK